MFAMRHRTKLRSTVVSALTVLLAVVVTPQTAHAADVCTPNAVTCPSTIYFGVSLPGLPRDLAGLRAFGTTVGKQPTVANYFAAFGDQLDAYGLTMLAADKRLPMVTWSPDIAGNTGANPYPLSAIAAGTFDKYLTAQGRALATVPGKVVVRFAHEMNGNWFPWGRGVNGNTDAQYVAAYRHVHSVVAAAGATNVVWAWSPAVTATPTELATLYPGSDYVDWVAPDLYFDHASDRIAPLWPAAVSDINTFAPDKPIFIAETGVLPGPDRPAQITNLISGLLHTPRLVGVTWFEEPGRFDWRISSDPAAVSALSAQLATPWFGTPGSTGMVLLPPLSQTLPAITGDASVGATLTASPGLFRSSAATGGVATLTGHWYRCADATATEGCVALAGATASTYTVTSADWNSYLRYRTRAANPVGTADAWSAAAGLVTVVPATPSAPAVTASSTALRVTLPTAPFGATHWRLTVDGKAIVPIPVGTATYWLLGLTNGQQYTITLAAADTTPTTTVYSPPVTLVAVPMTGPSTPYLSVTGAVATFQLPSVVPAGAQAWLLTLDGQTTTIATGTASWTSPPLSTGVQHSWSLSPAAGSGGPGGWGSVGAPSAASFTPVDTPAAPMITPISTGAVFTYPALPIGATGWQLTVGPTTYPTTAAASSTVTGLASGYAASWSLRAVNATARSAAVTGRFTPG